MKDLINDFKKVSNEQIKLLDKITDKLLEPTQKKVIVFDEYMTTDGEWKGSDNTSKDFATCECLYYCSENYNYYLTKTIAGTHYLFRCKT